MTTSHPELVESTFVLFSFHIAWWPFFGISSTSWVPTRPRSPIEQYGKYLEKTIWSVILPSGFRILERSRIIAWRVSCTQICCNEIVQKAKSYADVWAAPQS